MDHATWTTPTRHLTELILHQGPTDHGDRALGPHSWAPSSAAVPITAVSCHQAAGHFEPAGHNTGPSLDHDNPSHHIPSGVGSPIRYDAAMSLQGSLGFSYCPYPPLLQYVCYISQYCGHVTALHPVGGSPQGPAEGKVAMSFCHLQSQFIWPGLGLPAHWGGGRGWGRGYGYPGASLAGIYTHTRSVPSCHISDWSLSLSANAFAAGLIATMM